MPKRKEAEVEDCVKKLSPPGVRYELIPVPKEDKVLLPRGWSKLPAGSTITLTCSESTEIEGTLEATRRVFEKGFNAVPHIPARMVQDRKHLQSITEQLEEIGVTDVFVPGGDVTPPRGKFSSALKLLRELESLKHSIERIGITGYPQGHYDIPRSELNAALYSKEFYADYIVTQICCSPRATLKWLRSQQPWLPVYIGVVGIVERKRLLRVARGFGFKKAAWFGAKNPRLATGMFLPGGYNPAKLVSRTAGLDNVAGFHINTFNSVQMTEDWRREYIRSCS